MSKFSNYAENQVLGHLVDNTAITPPTLYASLHTADPGETGANELSGGGYLRVQVSAFDAAVARATANTSIIQFAQLTAAVGTITHVGLWDALSGGNLWWYSSALSSSIVTAIGIVPSIAAGDLDISLGDDISTYAANALLDLICSGTAFSPPTPYASLHTADPGLTGASEVSGNDYARVQVTAWDNPSGGATANTNAITFATPSPSDWGTVSYFGLFDASGAGNFLVKVPMVASIATSTSEAPEFGAGNLDLVAQ